MFTFIINNKTLMVLSDVVGFAVKESAKDSIVVSVFRSGIQTPKDIVIIVKEVEQKATLIQISELISHWHSGEDFSLRITSNSEYTEVKQ